MSRGREFFDLVLPGMTVELRCVACGAWFRWTAGRTVNDPPSHCSDRCRKRHHQILAMVDADRSLCPRPEKRVYLSHADAERACNRIRRHDHAMIRPYRCQCGFLHIGLVPFRIPPG